MSSLTLPVNLLGFVLAAADIFGSNLTGLILRAPQRWLRLGWDSWAVLVCYGAGLLALYQLR